MNIDILVETSPGIYESLDLFNDESIVLNFKLKDLSDIGKVFTTYTQEFTIPTGRNEKLLKFIFDSDVYRLKNNYINTKIYINSKLFKVGKLKVNEIKKKYNNNSSISVTFFTVSATLKDVIGEKKISELGFNYNFSWSPRNFYFGMTSPVTPEVYVPLISNKRVLTYGTGTNDIKWVNSSTNIPKAIDYSELRPAIQFSYVMDSIINYFNLNIEAPIFNRSEYQNLFIHLTKKNIKTENILLPIQTSFGSYIDYNTVVGGSGSSLLKGWDISANTVTSVFTISRTSTNDQNGGFDIVITASPLVDIGEDLSATVEYIDLRPSSPTFNTTFYKVNTTINNGKITSVLPLSREKYNTITPTNPLIFKVLVTFNTITSITNIDYLINIGEPGESWRYKKESFGSFYNSNRVVNLFGLIPEIKVIDFFDSFFKMFNIRVLEDKTTDKLYFLTPQDFVGSVKDYTKYVDIESSTIKVQKSFKNYVFSHADSKYKSNIDLKNVLANNEDSKAFGQLLYVNGDDYTDGEYKVETKFSIVPQVSIFGTNVQTQYGFDSTDPVDDSVYGPVTTGGKYTPNYDEFTLLYKNNYVPLKDINFNNISFGFRDNVITPETLRLTGYVKTSLVDIDTQTGYTNSLTFKDEVNLLPEFFIMDKHNLFINNYKDTIKLITSPNSFIYEFNAILPENVIKEFDMRDDIIIGERKYKIEEANIDLFNGKTKLKLINIPISNTTNNQNTPTTQSMWTISSYVSPNLNFIRNYGSDTSLTVQTSIDGGNNWNNSTGGTSSPRNVGALASGTLIRIQSTSDSTISNTITV